MNQISSIQSDMKLMMKEFDTCLGQENYLYLSIFPNLGYGKNFFHLPDLNDKYYFPNETAVDYEIKQRESRKNNPLSESKFIDDIITTDHPRFESFSKHCREKNGRNPCVKVPIYVDEFTENDNKDEIYPGFIYNDCFASGMGNCCLQITAGMENINCAMYIYDQLIPLMPILCSLTASSPFFKGKLGGWDHRFYTLYQACDERSDEELDPNNINYQFSSRFSYIYSYISNNIYIQNHHIDLPNFNINQKYYDKLIKKKFPDRFAKYICNLLVRDPMCIFDNKIEVDDNQDPTHFLNFMSTNWNSIRFKPPLPLDKDHLFKLEVRPCDLQLTPFENAAIVTFVMLFIEAIKSYDLNFIIPMSLSLKNFDNSVLMDYLHIGKFYWRENGIKDNFRNSKLCKNDFLENENPPDKSIFNPEEDIKNIKEMTINEILNGNNNYLGIIPVLVEYATSKYKDEELDLLLVHLEFIKQKSQGTILF